VVDNEEPQHDHTFLYSACIYYFIIIFEVVLKLFWITKDHRLISKITPGNKPMVKKPLWEKRGGNHLGDDNHRGD